MNSGLVFADSHALHEPFAEQLRVVGPRGAFLWLTELLERQEPSLRSQNSSLLAYTGCAEAVDWIESNASSPVTEHWGQAAALLGTPWPRLAGWLAESSPKQLVALDALVAYRAPAPNMSPLAQIAGAVLAAPPSLVELDSVLEATLQLRSTPRVRKCIASIREHSSEILRGSAPAVAVAELPRLFLAPESFEHAPSILSASATVAATVSQSIAEMVKKLRAN